MPNYNSTLQMNNSSLEGIIAQINNLSPTPPSVEQATPSITVDTSTGLITATANQSAGYVVEGAKITTKQLAFKAASTLTPGTTDQTAVPANTYVGGAITVKGDSNLVAGNIVSGKSIFGVVGTATAGGGGNTELEDAFVTRTITSYTNDRVKSIGVNAFYSCSRLTSVDFPACTSIGSYAFYGCSSLTNVSFPACTSMGSYAFGACSSLTSANFPVCKYIDRYAFNTCSSLTSANFPVCKYIGSYAFYGCSRLTNVSFPACTGIGSYAFQSCTSLASIYLGASTVCKLSNSNAFSNTGIGPTIGSIFVPSSLVASYKTATNWTYFSNRIYSYTF